MDEPCPTRKNDQTVERPNSEGEAATLAPTGKRPTPPDSDNSGVDLPVRDFGDYELLEELARGGMGIVYKARNKELNRIVALKMIISGQYSSDLDVQRFQLEAKAAAQLDHPGIVPIYEISSHQGQPYFAMKLVEGGSLAENRSRFLGDARKTATLIAEAARAVHHAHQRGILHRDIKPANILLDENDHPLITDLGLAKLSSGDSNLTQTGAVLGTPSYMPPEQARSSQSLTTAVDIYALGAILYELLVGKPPHRGDSALETVLQVLNETVVPVREIDSRVDRDLELICMNCLKRDPEARYASASDLADDLERWLDGSPISIKPASLFTRSAQWIRHNQGIAYVVMLLLTGMTFSLPLVFSILGILDDAAAIYANTESDPQPLIYSFTNIPVWVSVVCGIGCLLCWPVSGMLVTLVTRPPNWRVAAVNGSWVAGITVLLMFLLMGWAVFAIASQLTSNEPVRLLASNLWPPDEDVADSSAIKARLLEKYPMLETVPYNQKVNFLSNRILADGVAIGPRIAFGLSMLALMLGLPIVFGSVIAYLLLLRGHRWWFFGMRYVFAWGATFMMLGSVSAAFANGRFNNRNFSELLLWQQLLILTIPALVTYLVMRKWRQAKPDRLESIPDGSI